MDGEGGVAMRTYTPAELTTLILADGERLLALKHGKRPAPVWPRTAAVVAADARGR